MCEDELKFEGSRMWPEGDHIDLGDVDTAVTQCQQVAVRTICGIFGDFLVDIYFEIFD